jgi:hypothetical protein
MMDHIVRFSGRMGVMAGRCRGACIMDAEKPLDLLAEATSVPMERSADIVFGGRLDMAFSSVRLRCPDCGYDWDIRDDRWLGTDAG